MKWFKHFTDASNDEFLVELEGVFGLEGYARWWKLLEAIGNQMDKTEKDSAAFTWQKWQTVLRGKQNKLETFLVHCENKRKLFRKQTGNVLEITCPKLLELRDDYTKKSGLKKKKTIREEKVLPIVSTLKRKLPQKGVSFSNPDKPVKSTRVKTSAPQAIPPVTGVDKQEEVFQEPQIQPASRKKFRYVRPENGREVWLSHHHEEYVMFMIGNRIQVLYRDFKNIIDSKCPALADHHIEKIFRWYDDKLDSEGKAPPSDWWFKFQAMLVKENKRVMEQKMAEMRE